MRATARGAPRSAEAARQKRAEWQGQAHLAATRRRRVGGAGAQSATTPWTGTKENIVIWSGSCETLEDCTKYTEQAYNWWAA